MAASASRTRLPTERNTFVFSSPEELLGYVRDNDVQFIDVRFCDLPGVMQHFNIPAASCDAELLEEGLAFDGSSIRGFQEIHESDMLLLPDVATEIGRASCRERTEVSSDAVRGKSTQHHERACRS